MGLSHLKLADGSTVDVKPNYSASITIANREKAFNWLRENGLGDIIKNEISVSFGRNEDTRQLICCSCRGTWVSTDTKVEG